MKKLDELKVHLKPGHSYRRADLEQFSKAWTDTSKNWSEMASLRSYVRAYTTAPSNPSLAKFQPMTRS